MRTLQEKYNAVLEGNFSKTQFRRDAAIEMSQFVSTVNSFDDTVAILKNKGVITEAKAQDPKYSTAKPEDTVAPDVLDTGIKFELDKKYGTLDVTPEQYAKCREMAIKNLAKDVLYYVKQDSEQLEAPGEKMEKVTLKEVKVKVAIPGQDEFEAEEGKNYSEEEADKYIANAKKTGATPMNTTFTKVNEETDALFARKLKAAGYDYDKMMYDLGDAVAAEEGLESASADELKIYAQIATRLGDDVDVVNAFEYLESLPNYKPEYTPVNLRKANEAIQNIENDEYTVKRIAKLTNQLLQDTDPRDEVTKAYAISVKNDLESGDASRLKRYKDLLSLDDLKDDMEDYIGRDKDQLEENQYSISDIQSKFPDRAFDIQQAAVRAVGARDVQSAYSKSAGEFEQALYRAAHRTLEEEDLSEPDAKDLYQHDDEYLAQLKQRKALKEMFKKIITKVVND